MENQKIIVIDFGGQYKELIAKAVRGQNVLSIIKPCTTTTIEEIKEINPIGLILTGGPNSVYGEDAPKYDRRIFDLGIPILGICYGAQLIAHVNSGVVIQAQTGEYGIVATNISNSILFSGLPNQINTLMSHRDIVSHLSEEFKITATTANNIAAFENNARKLYGVQFHPETTHTQFGKQIIGNFLYEICKANGDYLLDDYINAKTKEIQDIVGDKRVLMAISGGIDSAVAATLISKSIADRLKCVFVDSGLMRLNEGDNLEKEFHKLGIKVLQIKAEQRFLNGLKGIDDPEKKRKIIGAEFVHIFEEIAKQYDGIEFLGQGTIYPDIIESGGLGATIKSHHNVGGLPDVMKFEGKIEPLSGLFKDEVRELGKKLGLDDFFVSRQPFPGPGLGIRVIGEVTKERLEIVRQADDIWCRNIEEALPLKERPSQYFAAITNSVATGIKGDARTRDQIIALRAIDTDDFMTCTVSEIPHKILLKSASDISKLHGVSRVLFEYTGKPPATTEYE